MNWSRIEDAILILLWTISAAIFLSILGTLISLAIVIFNRINLATLT